MCGGLLSRSTLLPTAMTARLVPKQAQINMKTCLHGPFQMAHGSAFTLTSPDGREFLQQYPVTPHCTTGRTLAELMLGYQIRSSFSVLQPRKHEAKLHQKTTLPAKPKLSISEHVHYRDFTRNRPNWLPGKVIGHVGRKMFIAQGPDAHCRRHEDKL